MIMQKLLHKNISYITDMHGISMFNSYYFAFMHGEMCHSTKEQPTADTYIVPLVF